MLRGIHFVVIRRELQAALSSVLLCPFTGVVSCLGMGESEGSSIYNPLKPAALKVFSRLYKCSFLK